MNQRKNYYVEFLRFLFCIIILFHHSGLFPFEGKSLLPSGGLIADAFFMITGYFACRHIELLNKKPGEIMKYSLKYTLLKLVRAIPYVITGVVIVYVLDIINLDSSATIGTLFSKFWNMTAEILLLPMTGVVRTDLMSYLDAPLWYLSAMMIALPLIMYIAMRFEDLFKGYIVWFAPMMLQGWMVKKYGGALPWSDYALFVHSGAVRAFASIMMGFGIYYASRWLSVKYENTTKQRMVLFTIVEVALLIVILLNIYRGVSTYDEIATLYLLYVMFIFVFSGITGTSRIKYSFLGYLGGLSLPIYCIHWGIFRWIGTYLGSLGFVMDMIIGIITCLIIAMILVYLNGKIIRQKTS